MNRLLIIFYLVLLHTSPKGFSQTDKYKGESFLFKDAKTNDAIVIEHDSIFYRNNPDQIQRLKHSNYPEIISRYNAFQIKGKNYFAHNGCGPVLEWRNDSIVRIDKSFLHQNQFGSSNFVYKNEIYYFGGYGLFTYKNILTKYIFKSREWMSIQTFGNEFPSPRRDANIVLIGDALYVFGGWSEDPDSFYFGQKFADDLVWKLNLKSMKWSKEGVYDTKYNSIENHINFQVGSKMYMLSRGSDNKLLEIDIENNTIKKYLLPSLILPKFIYFDEKSQEVVALHFLSTNASSKIIRLKLKTILVNPIYTETFITTPYSTWMYSLLLIGLVLFLFYLFYKLKIKGTINSNNSLLFDSASQQLLFKGKIIDAFDANELKIILHLIKNQADYIPLNSLNNLFEQEEITENYSSTTKRRETTLNNIITKLSLISGNKESEIVLYRKNPDDKRMKEVKLKDQFIRLK